MLTIICFLVSIQGEKITNEIDLLEQKVRDALLLSGYDELIEKYSFHVIDFIS